MHGDCSSEKLLFRAHLSERAAGVAAANWLGIAHNRSERRERTEPRPEEATGSNGQTEGHHEGTENANLAGRKPPRRAPLPGLLADSTFGQSQDLNISFVQRPCSRSRTSWGHKVITCYRVMVDTQKAKKHA